jgi:hypothetical protein
MSEIVEQDITAIKGPLDDSTLPDYMKSPIETHFPELGDIGSNNMTMRRGIIIELSQDRSNFKIWSPYDEGYKDELKEIVPCYFRSWDKKEKCWRVNVDWFGNVQRLLKKHYPNVKRVYTNRALRMCEQLVEEEREETERNKYNNYHDSDSDSWSPSYNRNDDPYEVLGVQKTAPDEIIIAAYRAQARMHHTDMHKSDDTKSDDTKMKQINAAFELIRKDRQWDSK